MKRCIICREYMEKPTLSLGGILSHEKCGLAGEKEQQFLESIGYDYDILKAIKGFSKKHYSEAIGFTIETEDDD